MTTLRAKQIEAVERMLGLNKEIPSSEKLLEQDIIWKILVLDKKSTNIVSSILSVNDLLNCGITMHTLISSPNRASLPDVPAIYFLEPTKENVLKIVDDIEKDYYSEYYVNFLSSLDRDLLEEFANLVSLTGMSQKVKQVFDQYLDYLVTEPQLFSLDMPKIYSSFNNPAVTEDEVTKISDKISNGLFNLIITLDTIPIIRAPRGGPAEFVAQKLDSKLRDHVINLKSISGTGFSHVPNSSRQVLVLLDRNMDLSAMFSHSWIYSCMISDVFDLHRNSITVKTTDPDSGKVSSKKYYIDESDFFWEQNSAAPFPDVVENIEKESNEYRDKAEELTSRTGVTSLSDIDPTQSDTYQIQQAVKQLPELTAKKQVIDMHMSILDALLKELQANNLDVFFDIEQNYKKDALSKVESDFLTMLKKDSKQSNKDDKLRAYLILYLNLDLSKNFCETAEAALKDLECDLSPLAYIKKVKEIVKLTMLTSMGSESSGANYNGASAANSSSNGSLFSGISSKLFDGSKLTNGVGSIISGLKTLLPDKQSMPITNLVESIMEPSRSNQITLNTTDDYLYFDPYMVRGNHSKLPKRQTYHSSIVFVVGGGNYLEYQNLQEWVNTLNNDSASTGIKRSVIYGSTDIVNPKGFLKECGELGDRRE